MMARSVDCRVLELTDVAQSVVEGSGEERQGGNHRDHDTEQAKAEGAILLLGDGRQVAEDAHDHQSEAARECGKDLLQIPAELHRQFVHEDGCDEQDNHSQHVSEYGQDHARFAEIVLVTVATGKEDDDQWEDGTDQRTEALDPSQQRLTVLLCSADLFTQHRICVHNYFRNLHGRIEGGFKDRVIVGQGRTH